MKRNQTEEWRNKNIRLPTIHKTKPFLQDLNVSACTYEIWKKKKKEEKNHNLEESSQNLHKESHNLQRLNIPNKEERLSCV